MDLIAGKLASKKKKKKKKNHLVAVESGGYLYQLCTMLARASRVEFENERIPTLKEAVTLCKELGLVMLIELKNTSDIEKVSL